MFEIKREEQVLCASGRKNWQASATDCMWGDFAM
jgi:hypothetical protein